MNDKKDIVKLQMVIDHLLVHPNIYFLGTDPRHESFMFSPSHNENTFQAHFAVLPEYRKFLRQNLIESVGWIFDNTSCTSLIGYIKESNRAACLIASHLGMKRIGVIENSCFTDKFVNEVIYYGTKETYDKKYRGN